MSDNNNGNCGSQVGGMIGAFAIGALVGAGVALLLAPRSGRETRDLLSKKGRDLGNAARDSLVKGSNYVKEASHRLASSIEAGKKAVEEIEEEVTK